MQCKIFIFLFFFQSSEIYSQIRGKVLDSLSKKPIVNVNIIVNNNGTSTDNMGEFNLDVEEGTEIQLSHIGYKVVSVNAYDGMSIKLIRNVLQSNEIIVKAGLSRESLQNSASSISIITNKNIRDASEDNLLGLLDKIPNLNWAGGTSRPRYFQIRGIGENSHYFGEGPPNFSIGYVVDDMDLSGMGMVGQLFDVQQVEVFKGPQSSVYGANAIAGLISIHSNNPTDNLKIESSLYLGSDNYLGMSALLSNKITDNSAFRLSGVFNRSDGFSNNISKKRTDTNSKQESLLRMKLKFSPSEKFSFLNTILYSYIDNGYDIWAPDNNTNYKTYTDDIGEDSQISYGYSLNGFFQFSDQFKMKSITSITNTNAVHSYDSDWGDSLYYAINHDWTPAMQGENYFPIKDFYKNQKDRLNVTQELRSQIGSLIAGIYYKNLTEEQNAKGYLYAGEADEGTSSYDFEAIAGYMQYKHQIVSNINFKANLRIENNKYTYQGNSKKKEIVLSPVNYSIKSNMMGFRASIGYNSNQYTNYFISLSRGYKAGGINQQPNLLESSRSYGPEYADNLEIGFKIKTNNHHTNFTVFSTVRKDQQVSVSDQVDKTEPNSFLFYISNAGSGTARGIEYEHSYKIFPGFSLISNIGLLDTWVDKFTYQSTDWEGNIFEDYGGKREASMAPEIMGSIGAYFSILNFSIYATTTFKGQYYFSDSHDEKSYPYSLSNMNINKSFGSLSVNIYVKNIFDERYPVRGFYFGLVPPEYSEELWLSYGNPRQYGLTINYSL